MSASYYRAIRSNNADVVTAEIEKITPRGIRTADGREHDVDLLILATGFQPHNYMRPMKLHGRDGLDIDDAWAERPTGIPDDRYSGVPELLHRARPQLAHRVDIAAILRRADRDYIAQWLRRFRDGEFDTVEVTEQATTKFNDDVAAALGPTVWNTGCNSWYLTDEGNIDLWPYDRKTMTAMLARPDDRDFHIA